MSRKMLINATHLEENRVAIVEDGILSELDIEVAGREPTKGNIYKAVVVRVEPGLQAAFVDYGAERLGFLQIDEINFKTVKPDLKSDENRRPRITDLLHRGQELLVQIIKEERGTKGAALTTFLSLAGRYMVLMPDSKTHGVSRKAENDSQRKQLKKAMATLELPENIGYIVRTAALDQTREELERDYRYLIRLYESIVEQNKKIKAPAQIYKESNLVIRSIRDYFTTDMDEVLIDDPEVYKETREFFQMLMPDYANLVKLHQERRPIFSRYQIEDQIETISRNKVPLPSGGSIVIDQTEALVAIDINSGKMASEQGVEATATKTNLEAAEEIGRQLRLRDLGGLVVIDFIDMRDRKHIRQVEDQLKKSMANDKARVTIGRISQFGLLEMSRQRIKAALAEGSTLTCPHCHGAGRVKSPETLAVAFLRRVHAGVAKGQIGRVEGALPTEVASYLLNEKRDELFELERRHSLRIHIQGRSDFAADQIELELVKRDKEKVAAPKYVEAATMLAETEKLPPSPAPSAEPSEPKESAAEGDATATPPKKRSRRRSRKAKSSTAPPDAAAANTDAAPETSTEVEVPAPDQPPAAEAPTETAHVDGEPVAEETDTKPAKPKRRRTPRKKPAAKEATSTEEAAHTEAPAPVTNDAPPESQVGEPVAMETPVSTATETATPVTGEAAPADQETEPAKPKRRRAPRKKPAAKEAAATETAEPPASPAAADAPPVTQEAEPAKPKRRRAPRKKPATAETATPDAPVTADTPAPVAADAPPAPQEAEPAKPKRRRTPRRKPATAETTTPPATPGAPVTADAPAPAAADAPPVPQEGEPAKPTRRRAPRKKPAPKEPAAD